MTSENALIDAPQGPGTTSENAEGAGVGVTQELAAPRRGRAPAVLPAELEAIHARYVEQLQRAPLSDESRRTYASKVRTFLAWFADADLDGEPLTDEAARDWAVRDYRTHLAAVRKLANSTVNGALAAVDDFYTRLGLGPAAAARFDLPQTAPRALDQRAALRWLRAANALTDPRDRALVLTPFYAGARIAEVVALDVEDVQLSARKGKLRLYGKGGKPRDVELVPELREAYQKWVDVRAGWPGAGGSPAVFLSRRGARGRISVRGASDVFRAVCDDAGLDDDVTAHILRHSFATTLVRAGVDIVVVAELLGHARLDQTRRYSLPTAEDREAALRHLPVDK